MRFEALAVPDAVVLTPQQHADSRGRFLEWFTQSSVIEAGGRSFSVAQANCSVSARGVLRGVHFADVPPGQAKYVTCISGSVLDVVVDVRVGSPTFGTWDSVVLDAVDHRAIYIPEGLGHAFLSLADESTVVYLCSTPYTPGAEHTVNPLDPALAIAWPDDFDIVMSERDASAMSVAEAQQQGKLPAYDACLRRYEQSTSI